MTLARISGLLLVAACASSASGPAYRGSYEGNASVVASIGGTPTGASGAAVLHVDVDEPAPTRGGLLFRLGPSCALDGFPSVVQYDQIRGGHGGLISAEAGMFAGQTCVLTVGSDLQFVVKDALATRSSENVLTVTIGGDLVSWNGAPASGAVTLTFSGARQ